VFSHLTILLDVGERGGKKPRGGGLEEERKKKGNSLSWHMEQRCIGEKKKEGNTTIQGEGGGRKRRGEIACALLSPKRERRESEGKGGERGSPSNLTDECRGEGAGLQGGKKLSLSRLRAPDRKKGRGGDMRRKGGERCPTPVNSHRKEEGSKPEGKKKKRIEHDLSLSSPSEWGGKKETGRREDHQHCFLLRKRKWKGTWGKKRRLTVYLST